jgi:UDPglucose--hexose-1-phosphate uridylyltransferase
MSELRQDPITRDWVIINPERARRPHDTPAASSECPFCPGHEPKTPDTIDNLVDQNGQWLVRVVPNKYPALRASLEGELRYEQSAAGWYRLAGYGHHEVLIETREHDTTLGLMPVAQARRVLEIYLRRYRALAESDGRLRQIVVFRNHGTRAGTSLTHPHSQIIATPAVSPETRRHMMDEIAFFDEHGRCGLCHILEHEGATAERVVLGSPCFVTLAPYASRNLYQLQIIPRHHCPTFGGASDAELDDLASHLTHVLAALHRHLGDPDYNLVVSTPPLDLVHRGANHWFIEILPRLTTPAGFELGSRIVVNIQTPEQAAAELRGALPAGAV